MKRSSSSSRRPGGHITLDRAARLHFLVTILARNPQLRDILLRQLGIGLRTFYRELELLNRCGVKIKLNQKTYSMNTTAAEAEGRLPFPDPQLSFAEMGELAQYSGPAAQRLAAMLETVIRHPDTPLKKRKGAQGKRGKKVKK